MVQKIVINRRWGGYGLSAKARLELYKKKSPAVEADDPYEYYGGDRNKDWKVYFEEEKSRTFSGHPYLVVAPDGKILSTNRSDEVRADKELVEVVEKLGTKANDWAASLKIVEVPDGVVWVIHDYDGMETVQEKHREWS